MYKFLLCWRYLRTRYIALVSIVSVMLGVAAMIATNAVMEGFSHELEVRTRGILADLIVEGWSLEGVPNAEWHMREIRRVAGEHIVGMTPTVTVPAMFGYEVANGYHTSQVTLIGIDEMTYDTASDLGKHLQHPENRKHLDFLLKDGGYDVSWHGVGRAPANSARPDMQLAGWNWRRQLAQRTKRAIAPQGSLDANPFQQMSQAVDEAVHEGTTFDPMTEQHIGCVVSLPLCSRRDARGMCRFLTLPGADVEVTFPSVSRPPKPLSAKLTMVDFYETAMADLDANLVFMPIRELQRLRGMIDPATQVGNFNQILITTRPGTDLNKVRDQLAHHFRLDQISVSTWRDKQGPLLGAIQVETGVLNVLLFLIVAVAGFSILAIFFMIVMEKTRDIGVLKSLGATGRGIMSIFLLYGLVLGVFGSGVGFLLGLAIVRYIDDISEFVGWIVGQPIFDPTVYGFERIPTIMDPFTVIVIIAGAIGIAVIFSILPAWRAARLHPVEALRYE